MAAILTALEPTDVLFIDEIHRLNRAIEELLYPAMEDGCIDIVIGQGPGAHSLRLELKPFTLVGATTRTGLLTTPLRDRFGITHRLDYYGAAELGRIVRALGADPRRCGSTRAAPTRSPAARGARRGSRTGSCAACATSPRCATRARSRTRIAIEALELFEVDGAGLERMDREILRAVAETIRGRAGRALDAGRRDRRGAGHAGGRLRAVPAPAGPAPAHAARAGGDAGRLRASRPAARRRATRACSGQTCSRSVGCSGTSGPPIAQWALLIPWCRRALAVAASAAIGLRVDREGLEGPGLPGLVRVPAPEPTGRQELGVVTGFGFAVRARSSRTPTAPGTHGSTSRRSARGATATSTSVRSSGAGAGTWPARRAVRLGRPGAVPDPSRPPRHHPRPRAEPLRAPMRTDDLDYDLPPGLIAQTAAEPRDSARLLVYDRATGAVRHRHFRDLLDRARAGRPRRR